MSLTVLMIAASHGIPPIIGAATGRTKTAVYVGAAIGGVIAVASGSPAYIVADLLGVALGVWLGLMMVQPRRA